MSDNIKTVLSNCDAKRDHNYRLGADNFTITTDEYATLKEAAIGTQRPEAGPTMPQTMPDVHDTLIDAERYRWLHNGDVDGLIIMRGHVEHCEDVAALVDGEELDRLVDAARLRIEPQREMP